MKQKLMITALIIVLSGTAFASGGGMFYGRHHYIEDYANTNLGAAYFGGFGYATSSSGARTGGFGFAISDDFENGTIAGGIGGIILGQELSEGPLMLSVNLWLGLGGMGPGELQTNDKLREEPGVFLGFGEVNAEVGLSLNSWMQIVGFAGMHVYYPFISEGAGVAPFSNDTVYTPVIGGRIAWGSF
ncbi:MAG: hypothetical protein ACLFR1_06525 [Spirochaetia bacterium]